jgi:3-deoxy-manno-octulosonate cytidylyltransferase (CMP-KDO synthetase)
VNGAACTFRIVIPARYASVRLPGKPLADILGKPMIVWVVEAANRSRAAEVVVATDDERVQKAVEAAGHRAMMTRADHPSGSDRIMEVARRLGWGDDDIVLNVQGDEPLIPSAVLDQLATVLQDRPELASATLCEPLVSATALTDPNQVKVVRDADGRALYFSRAPIPWDRTHFGEGVASLPAGGQWWRHIGVYAYRRWALEQFVSLPTGRLEAVEKLEQLRLLEHGLSMQVEVACHPVPAGVDTQRDLERARARMTDDATG